MNKKAALIIYMILIIALLLSGCGDNGIDTDENRELIRNHAIFSMELSSENLVGGVSGTWIAVMPCYDENEDLFWKIIDSSEDILTDEVLSNIDILAIINTSHNSAQYRDSNGNTTTGRSEYATIDYYNAHNGDFYGDEWVSAGALPEKASSTPDYRITNSRFRKIIKDRLESGIDPDYEIERYEIKDDVLISIDAEDLRKIAIPDSVLEVSETAISQLGKSGIDVVDIPSNVTKIALPDDGRRFVIGVEKDSYAEQYAIENGYLYYIMGTDNAYLPEGVTEYDKVRFSPNGEYNYIHVPSCVTYIRDGVFDTNYTPLVVEPGSYAEQYALEIMYPFCYEGHQEEIIVPVGREYAFFNIDLLKNLRIIHMPETIAEISDQMDGYYTQEANHLTFVVTPGSFAESYARNKGINVAFK